MKLDELTLGEIKQLQSMFGSTHKSSSDLCCDPLNEKMVIVVLQRGWVVVGKYSREGTRCELSPAAVVRRWGTTNGLPELASNGPLSETKLEKASQPIVFHELTTVLILECDESKWKRALC